MIFLDKHSGFSSERTYTKEGFLVVSSRIAKTGLQDYRAIELDPEGEFFKDPMQIVTLYRPPEEVFNSESMDSFKNKTITDNHPTEFIDSKNNKSLQVGHAGSDVTEDGDYLRVTLHITVEDAIKDIENGKVELSPGYESEVEFIAGTTPDGKRYDAKQTNIRANHIAIVEKGRSGSTVKISDKEVIPMGKIKINDVDYEMPDQTAQAVTAEIKRITDAAEAEKELSAEEKKKKDEEIKKLKDKEGKMEAEKDDLKEKKELTDASFEGRVSAEIELRDSAKAISPDLDFSGKSGIEIKKAVVLDRHPDLAKAKLEDESYINARFDILGENGSDKTQILDSALSKSAEVAISDEDFVPLSEQKRQAFIDKNNK